MGDIVDAFLLVEVVQHDDLVFFVFVGVELGDELIGLYANSWEVQSLADVVLFVLFGLSEIDEKEIGLNADWKLLSFDGDGC